MTKKRKKSAVRVRKPRMRADSRSLDRSWHSPQMIRAHHLKETARLLSFIGENHQNAEHSLSPVFRLLSPRCREIIKLRFGIGYDPHTLDDCGTIFKVSRERIRQLQRRALSTICCSHLIRLREIAGKGWDRRNGNVYITTKRV